MDTTTQRTATDLIGQPVISWTYTDVNRYEGESDHPGMTSLRISLLHPGSLTGLTADLHSVAPAATPIPVADERVRVTKSSKDEARAHGVAYPSGPWRLDLPAQNPSWHRTKRDATTTGLRRVAIIDWHTPAN